MTSDPFKDVEKLETDLWEAADTHPDGHATAKTVTVMNNGSAPLKISQTINGLNAADFVVTGGICTTLPGGTLAGNSSCTYTLVFTPSIVGPESATLAVSAVAMRPARTT